MPGNYRNEEGTSIDNVRTTGGGFAGDQKTLGTNFDDILWIFLISGHFCHLGFWLVASIPSPTVA